VIGTLDLLGRITAITAPAVIGRARLPDGVTLARRAVGYREVLYRMEHKLERPSAPKLAAANANAVTMVFPAPTGGRYYGRPSPNKPPFIEPGAAITPGMTICMLEVMKTFHRVTYDGAPARVRAVLVADGADVNAGDPLLALEPS
jgi:biotin carboxyl carrier protein